MRRVVQSEILDDLPADDPRAIHSRGDLRRVNWLMGNAERLTQACLKAFPQGVGSVLEIGSGDATLLLQVARKVGWKRVVRATCLDRQNLLSSKTIAEFTALGWQVQALETDLLLWAKEKDDCV